MKNRYFLEIAFNGSNYHGWQVQPETLTVQGQMNKHISVLLGEKITCQGCGRTDAGVHANKYLLHFNTTQELNDTFRRKLDRFLPLDISVKKIYLNQDKIHARWDALEREYVYLLSKGKNPFMLNTATLSFNPYDIKLMNEACQIVKEHQDFEAFCKANNNHNHYLCDIYEAHWEETDTLYKFTIRANRFLRSMIRLMVGSMIQVGRRKITLDEFRQILELKDRTKAGKAMPPQGLYFNDVTFPEGRLQVLE